MKQTLHALVVNVERRRALAATYGSRWLLPVLTCDARTRPLPIVARWLVESGIRGEVAGQWLGRVTDASIDWLVAIPAFSDARNPPGIEWQPLDLLASSPSLLEYQGWALAQTLRIGPLPSVDGVFGHLSWPQDVRRWLGAVSGAPVDVVTPYRCGAHEVVVGARCGSRRVFFKGLVHDRVIEAHTTRALAGIEPESFARTIAEIRRDGCTWWLTAECAGRTAGDLQCVARALARIQQRVCAASPPGLSLPRIDLDAAERWASELLGDSPQRDVLARACTRLRAAGVPVTWIPMDLDPTNVLIDEGRVRFIDVDDSFLGPAPLAMATLAMRCADRSAYRTYLQSWTAAAGRVEWRTFEAVAALIHAWLGWTRLERNVARGEVFVDLRFAASCTRARLSRAIDERWPSPARQAGPAA